MQRFTSIWEVTPETAHPRARQLFGQSIIWDYGDEDSPLGNDTGADTFAAYLEFRANHPDDRIQDFIHKQLATWEITDTDWDLLDAACLDESLGADGFSVLRRDDFMVGLAFAQLLLEGTLDNDVRYRAITALRRQSTDIVLSFRGSVGEAARKEQLAEFRRILESS